MTPQELSQLPPDVQQQIAALLRQRGSAASLAQAGMTPSQNEVINGRVIPTGGGQILAKVLSSYFGNRGLEKADEGIASVRQADLDRYSQEAGALTGGATRESIASALASKDPRIAALAASLQKRQDEKLKTWAGTVDKIDAPTAANAIRDEAIPGGPAPAPKQPVIDMVDDGMGGKTPMVKNYGTGGLVAGTIPAQTRITNQIPGSEAGMSLDVLKGELKERRDRAQIAKEALSSNRAALEAINDGAKSGGLQDWAQIARKVAQGFGVEFNETTSTEELNMALGNAVLAKARALAPVTGEDVKRLQEILGSLRTDPAALAKMISIYDGIALKEVQDFNKYVNTQTNNLKSPYARDMFSGATIGLEPVAPGGNTGQGLRSIQELAKRGGDPSQFAVGGEPIPADARFDLRGQPQPKPAAGKPLTIDQLTPEQLKALEAVLRARQNPGQ